MIGLPRSTYYYRAQEGSVTLTDGELEELIGTVQDELPGYGYRRVTHEPVLDAKTTLRGSVSRANSQSNSFELACCHSSS